MITLNSFIDSCDICFIQEHWLSNALLHKIGEISQDFVCTSVSGTGCPSSGVLSTIKRQAKKRYNLKYAVLNADANILFVIGLPIPSQRESRILSGWMLKVSNLMLLVFLLLLMVLMVIPTLLMPLHLSLVLC